MLHFNTERGASIEESFGQTSYQYTK